MFSRRKSFKKFVYSYNKKPFSLMKFLFETDFDRSCSDYIEKQLISLNEEVCRIKR